MDIDKGLIPKPINFLFYFTIFIAIFTINITFISSNYHYDSIILAKFAESGSFFVYGLRQHVFLTLINSLFYHFWSFFSPSQSALLPLAVLSCFIGALGIIIFCATIEILFSNRLLALFAALGLAFSFNYWKYSTLVETHILSTFFLILSIYFLSLSRKNGPSNTVILAGISTSLSLLSSSANIVFLPALLVFLSNTPSSKNKKSSLVINYLIALIIFWLIPYFLIGLNVFSADILCKKYVYNLWGLVKFFVLWFKSALYIIPFRLANIITMARENTNSIIISGNKIIPTFTFYTISGLLFLYKRKGLTPDCLNVLFSVFWAAFLFFGTLLFYEPFNLQRYTPFLIFIWLFACVLLKDLFCTKERFLVKLLPFLIVIFLFLNNFIFSILPDSKDKNNLHLQVAMLIKNNSGENDIIITRGMELWPNGTMWSTAETQYIPYFAKRRIISFSNINKESLKTSREVELSNFKKKIDTAIDKGGKVLLLRDALIANSGESRNVYPLFYSKLSGFLEKDYCISVYIAKNKIVIYRLTKREAF